MIPLTSTEAFNQNVNYSILESLEIDEENNKAAVSTENDKALTETSFARAEKLRKTGNYQKALEMFEDIIENMHEVTPEIQWRLAYCYRQLDLNGFAMLLASSGINEWPDNRMLRSEYCWAQINAVLKPAVKDKDHKKVIKTAEKLIYAGAESVALIKAYFAAVNAAKALNRWDIVAIFSESIKPGAFPDKVAKFRKSNWSDAERYYISSIKAQFKLQNYKRSRELALEAAERFKTRFDFHRFAALSLQNLGHPEEALEEMINLQNKHKLPWYFLADIAAAQLYCNKNEEALKSAISAVRQNGIPQTKVNLYELLGDIYQALKMTQKATTHYKLSIAIRKDKDWKLSEKLKLLEAEHFENDDYNWKRLFKQASGLWEEKTNSRSKGKVIFVDFERNIGFIKPETGGKIFFRPSENTPLKPEEGENIIYSVRNSFDRSKQKESQMAYALESTDK